MFEVQAGDICYLVKNGTDRICAVQSRGILSRLEDAPFLHRVTIPVVDRNEFADWTNDWLQDEIVQWIEQSTAGNWNVEAYRASQHGETSTITYMFSNEADAVAFKLRFN